MRVLFVMFAFFKDAFLNALLIIPDLWESEAAGTTVFKASLRYIEGIQRKPKHKISPKIL